MDKIIIFLLCWSLSAVGLAQVAEIVEREVAYRPITTYNEIGEEQKHVKVLINDGEINKSDVLNLMVISVGGKSLGGITVTLKYKDKVISIYTKTENRIAAGGAFTVELKLAKDVLADHHMFDTDHDIVAYVKAIVK